MKYPEKNGQAESVSDFQENYESGARYRLIWDSVINHPYIGFKKPYGKDTAWLWMIFEARRKPQKGKLIEGKTPMNDRCIDIPYASFVASRSFLAKAWGWSEQSVRTFLEKLKKLNMIETKVIQNLTMITICNFEDYQNPSTNRQPDANQSSTRTPTGKQDNKTTFPETSWQYRFAKRFWEKKQNNYGHYSYIQKAKEDNFQTWADELDKLNRIDEKEQETIRQVLKFATEDDFWEKNLLSLAGIRKPNDSGIPKFEVIESKMKNFSNNGKHKEEDTIEYEYWN
jgi:hypothetical protein